MAEEGVVGVDVLVKVGDVAILGQRGAKMTYTVDMVDVSTKADFPYKKSRPGWEGAIIDCDCLMEAGGAAGMAGLVNTVQARTLVEVTVTIGESGEELSGDAWMIDPNFDAPHTAEGTMSCRLQIDGQLTATEGT